MDRMTGCVPTPGLQALLELEGAPRLTGVCVLADKEEIGSLGVTGMQSAAFDIFMSDLCDSQGAALKACYENAFCLSADVTAAYDPNFAEAYEVRNSAFLNYGVCLSKYTGPGASPGPLTPPRRWWERSGGFLKRTR